MTTGSSAPWGDRIYRALPMAPVWASAALAALLVVLVVVTTWAAGDLEELRRLDVPWWRHRDGRLAALLVLTVSYLPAARRYQDLGTRRDLRDLRTSPAGDSNRLDEALHADDAGARRVAGGVGLLLLPVTALLVDRDPGLYLQREYWNVVHFWTVGLGAILCWNVGVLAYTIVSHGRRFSKLARELPRVDLLDLAPLAPFARQGLRAAIPGIALLSFLAFNLFDRGFLWAVAVLGVPAVAWIGGALLLPTRGLRDRIREAKRAELARVNGAIRGDAGALAGSPLAGRGREPGLAELLAWREFVASVPEWPFDAATRARFALYAAIPLGSWLGGAIVERLLGVALG